jgi:aconitate hydratase
VINLTKNETYETEHPMTPYQVEMVLAGSLINLVKQKGLSPAKTIPGC